MALGNKACHIIYTLEEVFQILLRALAAAHTYETLRACSDEELARRSLKRTDLPRCAFHVLTDAC